LPLNAWSAPVFVTLTRKPDLKEKLDILAEGMRRDQSKLVDEAIGLCRSRTH